jgi:hypothetical protein
MYRFKLITKYFVGPTCSCWKYEHNAEWGKMGGFGNCQQTSYKLEHNKACYVEPSSNCIDKIGPITDAGPFGMYVSAVACSKGAFD